MRLLLLSFTLAFAPPALAATQQVTPGLSFSWTFHERHPFGIALSTAWQVLPLDDGPSVGLFLDAGWQQGGFRIAGGPRIGLGLSSDSEFGVHHNFVSAEGEIGPTWSTAQGFGLRVGGVVSSEPSGFGGAGRFTAIWDPRARRWIDPTIDLTVGLALVPITYIDYAP